jgi:cysteine desulfurase
VAGSEVNGGAQPRLPNTTNVYVPGVHAEALQALLDAEGLAVSTGSACNSSRQAPSHVLLAMGMSEERAGSSIRLSLSRLSTTDEVEAALEILPRAVEGLRALAP